MKIALITDQHLGVRGDSIHFHNYFKRFYDEVFFPYIDAHEITKVVDLGDTFDRRKYVNFDTLKRAREYFFDELYKRGIDYDNIVGNHSVYFKNTNRINSADLLLNAYQFNIYTEPTEVELDGLKVLYVPWINSENYKRTLNLINETSATVLFGHLEIQGFEMYKGAINAAGLSRKSFKKFDMVLSGHFHHKSSINNIHYLGAPYEMTWSDYNDERGFHVLDTSTKDLTFVQNPIIMFNKVFYDDIDGKEEEILEQDFSHIKNTYVKVIVKNKNNPYVFDLFIDKLNAYEPVNMQVVEDNFNLNLEDEDDILDEAQDTITLIKQYIKNLNLEKPKPMEDLFYELYHEAMSIE
jgi:hypothetical protein